MLIAAVSLFRAGPVLGVELSFPNLKAHPENTLEIPLMIDSVDNLAGVRLVIRYDAKILTYHHAKRTPQASGMMHIVNDKKPGTLILVMASARGIKGKHFSIITLTFQVGKQSKGQHTTGLKIIESQLMSDQLKSIEHTVRTNKLSIVSR